MSGACVIWSTCLVVLLVSVLVLPVMAPSSLPWWSCRDLGLPVPSALSSPTLSFLLLGLSLSALLSLCTNHFINEKFFRSVKYFKRKLSRPAPVPPHCSWASPWSRGSSRRPPARSRPPARRRSTSSTSSCHLNTGKCLLLLTGSSIWG